MVGVVSTEDAGPRGGEIAKTLAAAQSRAMARAMFRSARLILPALAAPFLAGCAATGDYPSLATREVERIAGSALPADAEPAPPAAPAPADAGTQARLRALVGKASNAHQRFLGQRGDAERLVARARGSAQASENWSVAIAAISGLEAARNEASLALADLDAMFAAERLGHYNEETGNALAMAEARDTVTGWIDSQNRAIDALARRLGV